MTPICNITYAFHVQCFYIYTKSYVVEVSSINFTLNERNNPL